MDLINDLGTDLAVAFLVEKRYRQKLDSEEALALIGRVIDLLESSERVTESSSSNDDKLSCSAH